MQTAKAAYHIVAMRPSMQPYIMRTHITQNIIQKDKGLQT